MSMGYVSRSGRSESSTSSTQIRVLEEIIEQKDKEARDANNMHREELAARLKHKREHLKRYKKATRRNGCSKEEPEEKNEARAKKQQETDNLISFLLRAQATQ